MDYWPTITVLEVIPKPNGRGESLEVKVMDSESGAIIVAGVAYFASYMFEPLKAAHCSGEEIVVHIQTKESNGKEYTNLTAIKGITKPKEGDAPPPAAASSAADPADPKADPPAGSGQHTGPEQSRTNPHPAVATSRCVWSMAEPDLRAYALLAASILKHAGVADRSFVALLSDCESYVMRGEGAFVKERK